MKFKGYAAVVWVVLLSCVACQEEGRRLPNEEPTGGAAGAGGEAGSGGGGGGEAGGGGRGEELQECKGLAYPCIGSVPNQVCKREGERVVCDCMKNDKAQENLWMCEPDPLGRARTLTRRAQGPWATGFPGRSA